MASDEEEQKLSVLWKTSRVGTLTSWSKCKVWALAEAWKVVKPDTVHGRNTWIKGLVEVVTEDRRQKKRPTEQAIGQLLAKKESDPQWFPGKQYGSKAGAKAQIPNVNKAVVARSAMALKESGVEPTYANVLARNPNAAKNPSTGEPMSPDSMSKIFKERCYDEVPEDTWGHLPRSSGQPLTLAEIEKRLAFGPLTDERQTHARVIFQARDMDRHLL